jgi:hypothetical protein
MIISASYRTDIPTFYGPWFIRRVRAGYAKAVNPYNEAQIYLTDLRPEAVDGFVFWTKNIGPFLRYLPEIRERGYPFVVQHTITGNPRELESRVMDYRRTTEYMKRLAGEYGSSCAVWRYDPILLTSLTPADWHRRRFGLLAKRLQGTTDEAVISFANLYQKTRRNSEAAAREHVFTWQEHEQATLDERLALLRDLAGMAQAHGMRVTICSQHAYLIPGVCEEARCIDAPRMERAALEQQGRASSLLDRIKLKGNREECGCYASKDIGAYDTCPHGCVYCYAVNDRSLALKRYKDHNPECAFLFPPKGHDCARDDAPLAARPIQVSPRVGRPHPDQGSLFPNDSAG